MIGENEDIWEVLGGSNKKLLTEKLAYIRKNIHSEKYCALEKIGFVLDADDVGMKGQIALLNEVLKTVFSTDIQLQNENDSIEIAFIEQGLEAKLSFIFYCMKVEDKGELFTVLRKIKKMESHYADCLAESWQKCYLQKEINDTHKIGENEFDKFWVQVYLKYDTVQKSKRDQKSTNLQHVFRDEKAENPAKSVFAFDSPFLTGLKEFLKHFS